MRAKSHYGLAGALALALLIGASGAAQAGGEQDRSSTWALGNIVQGLANALNGTQEPDRVATVQTSDGGAQPVAEDGAADQRAASASDDGAGS